MIDIKTIRENPTLIEKISEARGSKADISLLLAVDEQRKKLLTELELLRSEANKIAASIKNAPFEERNAIIWKGKQLKKQTKVLADLIASVDFNYKKLMLQVPNLLADDTPKGTEETDNIEVKVYGDKPNFDFKAKDHIELGNSLGMDFTAGAKVAGSGFPILKGDLAMLENAVLRFTLDQAINDGFTPINVPLLAKQNILMGLGFNPRRDDEGTEIFSLVHDDLCLAGTAEISLVGHLSDEILDSKDLPLKFAAMTPCFRREGSYGRRDAGLYRNKMFNKVELVVISKENQSETILEEILLFEVAIFKKLGIHFRVVRICAGDLGAPAYKKYDVEGWMKGRGENGDSSGWGELTSCSNCTDFQSRRLNIRHRHKKSKPAFVHTLNGTGITSRVLIPILEQYQNSDGSVTVPDVLVPYLNNKKILK
jgi:seryl-tRNA synthetase